MGELTRLTDTCVVVLISVLIVWLNYLLPVSHWEVKVSQYEQLITSQEIDRSQLI